MMKLATSLLLVVATGVAHAGPLVRTKVARQPASRLRIGPRETAPRSLRVDRLRPRFQTRGSNVKKLVAALSPAVGMLGGGVLGRLAGGENGAFLGAMYGLLVGSVIGNFLGFHSGP